ncbi:hypothetical protein V1289_009489 [Bradyrhizobium sp. AZCC 2289]
MARAPAFEFLCHWFDLVSVVTVAPLRRLEQDDLGLGTGHEGNDPCVPDGVIDEADLAALLPFSDALKWIFGDAVAGVSLVNVPYNGCAATGERKHPRDHGMTGFVGCCVIWIVQYLAGVAHDSTLTPFPSRCATSNATTSWVSGLTSMSKSKSHMSR